jgi:hypothetical protein
VEEGVLDARWNRAPYPTKKCERRGHMKWELYVEQFDHVETFPTWERVYEIIRQMDGENLTNFALGPLNGEGASLLCGGGDWIDGEKRYVVEYFIEENGSGYHLINPDEPEDQEYELTIQVQEDVIRAFAYFYQTGQRNPDLQWEEY